MVQLQVEGVAGNEVDCRVTVGGELSSRKGLNLPGIKLGISAITEPIRYYSETDPPHSNHCRELSRAVC